jgi:hypothetical protein
MSDEPYGEDLTLEERIAEVTHRYGPDHIVSRSWSLAFEDTQRLFVLADAITAGPVGQPDPLLANERHLVRGRLTDGSPARGGGHRLPIATGTGIANGAQLG